jgi:hypothetical protein
VAKSTTVVIDELHLTVRVPTDLPDGEADAVRRTLAGGEFTASLRRAVRVVLREFPDLAPARVTLSR